MLVQDEQTTEQKAELLSKFLPSIGLITNRSKYTIKLDYLCPIFDFTGYLRIVFSSLLLVFRLRFVSFLVRFWFCFGFCCFKRNLNISFVMLFAAVVDANDDAATWQWPRPCSERCLVPRICCAPHFD